MLLFVKSMKVVEVENMVKNIYEGLSIENGNVVYNADIDNPNDIIHTVQATIYRSEFGKNVYYFGYTFLPTSSRKDRTAIIKWLKNLDGSGISQQALENFIDKPIKELSENCDLDDFSCIVYPRSNRSNITKTIVHELNNFAQRDTLKSSVELVKSIPKDVSFDWEMFDSEYGGEIGDNQYNQIRDYIEKILMPKIHNLDYFSIADSVKPRYRRYIKDYLNIDKRSQRIIESIKGGDILIVDDINTSGSTLQEIIRIIRKINSTCEIYIFTLVGKE